MIYARLGDTGLLVSRLAFGAMTFGAGQGTGAYAKSVYKLDQPQADDIVARAIDAGINFFNTADMYAYGRSEEMLGKALGARRADVVIATKGGNRMGEALVHAGLSRRHLLAAAEASLRRLGTDYIDVYLLHLYDPFTPEEEVLAALDALVASGKVRYVGLSNWPAWRAAKAVGLQRENGWARFRAAEMYYSLLGRDLEHEFIPFAEDAGIGIMVWSPLAGGFLSGKYTREDPSGGGGRVSGFDMFPFDRERGYDLVTELKAIAAAHGATPAQVSLAWLLAQKAVSSILIGATSAAQLDDNLGAVKVSLTDADMRRLHKATAIPPPYPNWFIKGSFDGKVREALGVAMTRRPPDLK